MVVKMRKWLPWPPFAAPRKFQVYLTVQALEGLVPPPCASEEAQEGLLVDVKWKGPKGTFFRRRSLKRFRTSAKRVAENGIVSWEEKSDYECIFTQAKNSSRFQPWDVYFVVLKASHEGGKDKPCVIGTAVMDIANFIYATEDVEQTTRIKVSGCAGAENDTSLVVTVSYLELWSTNAEGGEMTYSRPSLPCGSSSYLDPQELMAGMEVPAPKNSKRPAEGKVSQELYVLDSSKLSSRSETSSQDTGTLFDSDSVEEYDDGRLEVGADSSFRKSFSYGTLAGANLVHEGALPSFREGENVSEPFSSIHSRVVADAIPFMNEDSSLLDLGQAAVQQSKFFSWKKRKLFFGSPRTKGEPLLNKSYGDDGGDDIDHDRRQSCSSPIEQLAVLGWKDENLPTSDVSECLDFGEEKFSVGSWEMKDFMSRDGHMKLSANVFFASIDQRNERAAGEGACTALVAVISDWLHRNPDRTPIKAEFDSLIRDGSAEWRRLCDNETYQNRFPDGHFDLETVLQAKVRPLRVAPERSFVGFFRPEGVADMCDFLEGAMLFDNIWDAIVEETKCVKLNNGHEHAVYIVSWNDHFFILKVDADAFYIIDTLGERLYEGCDQAYIIRFDKDAKLCHVPNDQNEAEEKMKGLGCQGADLEATEASSAELSAPEKQQDAALNIGNEDCSSSSSKHVAELREEGPIYEGKEACKCFLKEFFAAVPLRELQVDIKKGLLGKLPLHQRLQIEFHFMSLEA